MTPPDALADLKSPTLGEIEALADEAYAALPAQFRAMCAGVVVHVEDFPDEETLDDMECETEFDLLGLFRGRGLPQRGAGAETGELPNMVWLYRRPILDYWAENDQTLGEIVTHVLVHEIGHHFGLSDDDMAEIERRAD
jgi:predicted Zn-dependent protease with MMP-like domain